MEPYGLTNNVNFATCLSGNTLDLIITRDVDNISCYHSEPGHFISDHCFVTVVLNIKQIFAETKVIKFRKIDSIDRNSFKDDLLNSELKDITAKDLSLQEMIKLYDTTIIEILDKNAPQMTKTIKNKPQSPWYTDNLNNLKRQKRSCESKWKKSKLPSDYNKFRSSSNEYSIKCKEQKTYYYSKKIADCSGDQRKLYKVIEHLTNGEQQVNYPDVKNRSLSDEFVEFFSDKVDKIVLSIEQIKINEKIEDSLDSIDDLSQNTLIKPLETFNLLSSNEIKRIISNTASKSSSLDPFPTKLLKENIDVLIEPITSIVNKSLQTGTFPEDWKCAVITPIPKKNNQEPILSNFRPISNLSFLSKLVEKCALKTLYPHLENSKLFSKFNSAYRKHHSTETLLTKIHSDIMMNMDRQELTLLILLDLSAAFDSICQTKLLKILEHRFKIRKEVLNWLKMYILNRQQKVKVNDIFSKPVDLKHGVPQGSCVGPILFLVYISSLYDTIEEVLPIVEGYADDHQLYISFKPTSGNPEAAVNSMNKCISIIRQYMIKEQLKINDSKTEFLVIGTPQQLEKVQNLSVNVGTSSITPSKSVKNLGIVFDQSMTMEKHINLLSKRSFHQLIKIRQLRKYLDEKTTLSLVHSFITSSIDYCNNLFYGQPKYIIRKLQRIQNAAAKIITNSKKYDHVTPLLETLHWLPVEERIKFKIAKITYNCLKKLAPNYLCALVKPYKPNRTLRSIEQNLLTIPKTNTKTLGNKSFYVAAPTVWNSLPLEIRNSESLDIFKSRLKTYLFNSYFVH